MFRLVRHVIWGSVKRKSLECCLTKAPWLHTNACIIKHTKHFFFNVSLESLPLFISKSDNAKRSLRRFEKWLLVFREWPTKCVLHYQKLMLEITSSCHYHISFFSRTLFIFTLLARRRMFAKRRNWLSSMTDTFVNATCCELSTHVRSRKIHQNMLRTDLMAAPILCDYCSNQLMVCALFQFVKFLQLPEAIFSLVNYVSLMLLLQICVFLFTTPFSNQW